MDTGSSGEILNQYADDGADLDAIKEGEDSIKQDDKPAEENLSSPRAESARAFTGRRNSYSGRGEDFLTGQPNFFTETAVTPERKVEKWFPKWEINRHAEG